MSTQIRQVDITLPYWREQLEALHDECFRPEELSSAQMHHGHWWIAVHDGSPVGFAGLVPSARWGDTGYLVRAGVIEAARGQGLQKRLIAVRLAKARRLGWNWVITDTRRNPASANSLISAGFRMYQPHRPWSLRDACYWRKRLTP